MYTMATFHPLELPEIIERIGHFLLLWTQEKQQAGPTRTRAFFHPKTFLACLLVSRLWRRTLLPFLWTSYDPEGMEHVPMGILRNNSSQFSTFPLQRGQILVTFFFNCTSLVNLTLNFNTVEIRESRQTIRSNPVLKSLTWNGPTIMLRLPTDEFACLTWLGKLTLSFWNVSAGKFGNALKLLAGSIKELEISRLTGLCETDARWIPARVGTSNNKTNNSNNGDNEDDQEDGSLTYPYLE
jgi:hypothetical protein